MEIHSIEEAGAFYRAYGRSRGFITRKRSSYATRRGPQITRVIFVCCCEGLHKKHVDSNDDDGEKKKNGASTMRTGCEAMLRIALNTKCNTWYVNEFKDHHNHDMVPPRKQVFMKSNKVFPPATTNLAEASSKHTTKQKAFRDGQKNVPTTGKPPQKDIRDVCCCVPRSTVTNTIRDGFSF
ncbi:protein FAR1-RELATED SEQUENCE 5-like [Papaver somniferum]|uniref:protein FAR1-RELATED SEQUENCE 5-like n=1 Tax=Papaver somniferum TaxID=3469 RepID=UPI000E6F82E4|nr:protein FAR1-RELATED SEQUENCE 5-like [Papaver somniferum]